MTDLQALFGHIDIYLFDQVLRGRVPQMNDARPGIGERPGDWTCGAKRHRIKRRLSAAVDNLHDRALVRGVLADADLPSRRRDHDSCD